MPKVNILNVSYKKVALEIAKQIVEGKYQVGDRIKSRTTIAAFFNVSAETARKAINILADLGVMEVKHGSGAIVLSKEKARQYVNDFEATTTLNRIESEMIASIQRQQKELARTQELAKAFSNFATLFHLDYPFHPHEIIVPPHKKAQKSLEQLDIWNKTKATVIGIVRQEQLLLSPDPKTVLEEGDVVYFIGEESSVEKMQTLFEP